MMLSKWSRGVFALLCQKDSHGTRILHEAQFQNTVWFTRRQTFTELSEDKQTKTASRKELNQTRRDKTNRHEIATGSLSNIVYGQQIRGTSSGGVAGVEPHRPAVVGYKHNRYTKTGCT